MTLSGSSLHAAVVYKSFCQIGMNIVHLKATFFFGLGSFFFLEQPEHDTHMIDDNGDIVTFFSSVNFFLGHLSSSVLLYTEKLRKGEKLYTHG